MTDSDSADPAPAAVDQDSQGALRVTDPKAMRALAHPARIAIAQYLALDGPATATECARITGLSASACSYHLRALARWDFIEEDKASAADGRHRPWRARAVRVGIPENADQSAAMRTATRLLTERVHARFCELRAQYADRIAEYPPPWRAAAHLDEIAVHVTPDELTALWSALLDVLSEFRRADPGRRPPGARRVDVMVDLIPWFVPASEPSAVPEGPRE